MQGMKNSDAFWSGLKQRIEGNDAAHSGWPPRSRCAIVWNLFVSPPLFFLWKYLFTGGVFRGRKGLREAVHASVARFGVAAQCYERNNSDTSVLERIKNGSNPL
jgi:hypothetical protein